MRLTSESLGQATSPGGDSLSANWDCLHRIRSGHACLVVAGCQPHAVSEARSPCSSISSVLSGSGGLFKYKHKTFCRSESLFSEARPVSSCLPRGLPEQRWFSQLRCSSKRGFPGTTLRTEIAGVFRGSWGIAGASLGGEGTTADRTWPGQQAGKAQRAADLARSRPASWRECRPDL